MSQLQSLIDQAIEACLPYMLDRVTFTKSTPSIDTAGGHSSTLPNQISTNVPCLYRPARPNEIRVLGEKPIKGTIYILIVPAQHGSGVVDVDSSCNAVVAGRGPEPEKTFKVHWLGRAAGAVIKLLASIES